MKGQPPYFNGVVPTTGLARGARVLLEFAHVRAVGAVPAATLVAAALSVDSELGEASYQTFRAVADVPVNCSTSTEDS